MDLDDMDYCGAKLPFYDVLEFECELAINHRGDHRQTSSDEDGEWVISWPHTDA